jgi:hypothetical protein
LGENVLQSGGAIYSNIGTLTVKYGNFTGNSALYGVCNSAPHSRCPHRKEFPPNMLYSARISTLERKFPQNGGAIYNSGDLNINGTSFESNKASLASSPSTENSGMVSSNFAAPCPGSLLYSARA